jgi:hypothetical protein
VGGRRAVGGIRGGGPEAEAGGRDEQDSAGEEALLDLDSGDGRCGGRCDRSHASLTA